MDLFIQRVVDGIQNGAVYAAIALALVLIFQVSGVLNFAQGEMAMFSTFITWTLYSAGLPIVLAIIVSMVISFLGGGVIERLLIRPVAKSGAHLPVTIVTIGLFLAFNALALWLWGAQGRQLPSPFPDRTWNVGGVLIRAQTIGFVGVLLVVSALLWFLVAKTKIGLAMRAVASNSESSQLVGVRVGYVLMLGWALSAAIGTLGGALVATTIGTFDNNFMQGVLILAFAAATLGGLDSPVGAVVGGVIVGVGEALAGGYISDDFRLLFAFVLILAVLLVKPTGLFGSNVVRRV